MTRRVLVVLGVVALVVLGAAVAVVSDRDGGSTDKASAGDVDEVAGGAATGGGEAGAVADVAAAAEPRVVRRASLRLTVDGDSLSAAFERAASIASAAGGFVESSTSSDGAATLTLRVPADRFDDVRRRLGALGDLEGEELSGRDVSAQLVDHEARLASMRAQEEALRTLLARASAVGEILEVQSRLFEVRQQIEQLDAQRARLADAADLATISVSLAAPGAVRSGEADTSSPFERAWEGTVAVAGGMVIVVGYALPFGVLALLVWGATRFRPATALARRAR